MKLIKQNMKQGEVTLKPESQDDLWLLSQTVDSGDLISGKTLRKIKLERADSDRANVSKRAVFLRISAEKTDYDSEKAGLRISGKIVSGPDDVPKGDYHTFDINEGDVFTIAKQKWQGYQIGRIREASEEKEIKILICVLDREEAIFALMKKYGYSFLSRIKGDVKKKADDKSDKGEKIHGAKDFYSEITKQLEDYDKRFSLEKIIVASPAFWAEDLLKAMKNDLLKKKILRATCSSADETAIGEVLKRDEVKQAMMQQRFAKELKAVEQLMSEISKKAKGVYGLEETEQAADAGAIEILLVTDKLIAKKRQQGKFSQLEHVMRTADSMKAEVIIISSEHSGGKQLDGIGGIGAVLRYKLSYE